MDSLQDRARHEPFLTLDEEQALIARAQNGDRSAVERLVLSHLVLAQGEARRLGLGPGVLEDALQDAAEVTSQGVV